MRVGRGFLKITYDAKQQTHLSGWMYLGITIVIVGYTVNAGTLCGGMFEPSQPRSNPNDDTPAATTRRCSAQPGLAWFLQAQADSRPQEEAPARPSTSTAAVYWPSTWCDQEAASHREAEGEDDQDELGAAGQLGDSAAGD